MDAITSYHGSRGGLNGEIRPISRTRCDFGKGFYMGSNRDQARSLVANADNPYYYELLFDMDNIPENRILRLEGMEWAYFVLYNRGRLQEVKESSLYRHCRELVEGKDVMIGPIADDAMNETMNRFLNGDITDKAFLESIRALDYGIQYVAKTPAACACITVVQEKQLRKGELASAIRLANERRIAGGRIAEEMQRKYRREGRYFDELLEEARNH